MPPVVYVSSEPDGRRLIVRTPFSKPFVEDIRGLIPSVERDFDQSSKAWAVSRAHYTTMEGLIKKHFGENVQMIVAQTAQLIILDLFMEQMKDPVMEDYFVMGIRPEAADCILHSAFVAHEQLWATVYYLSSIGGGTGDKHLEGVPKWIVAAAEEKAKLIGRGGARDNYRGRYGHGQPDQFNLYYEKDRSRVAYLRICRHRGVEPIVPGMVLEQFKGKDMTPEIIMSSFDLIEAIKMTAARQ